MMRRLPTPLRALMLPIALAMSLVACGAEPDTAGHSISFNVKLVADDDGQLPFMTPAASAIRIAPDEVMEKPFFMAVFDAGFAPGIDAPRHFKWGTIDAEMRVDWTTPANLSDGPYDVVFILYRETEVPPEAVGTPNAVAAINGDLATFTIGTEDVRDGDPPMTAGVLRVNLEGTDATKLTENRWVDDLSDSDAGTAAFTDTVLLVP